MNFTVTWAVFKRNFSSYFINPTGYVFITVFILLGAIAAFWQEAFFVNNLANLDWLNAFFPLLLLFFVPALTMGSWSEERKLGTDELLFTLPGRDLDIVLGKYLAVLGIYTVALLFSLSHLVILLYLGEPDVGLIFATYLGYWFAGAALLSVGMTASMLTGNSTVAFILGSIFCGVFVFIHHAELLLGSTLGEVVRSAGIVTHFVNFGNGAIPLASVVYFLGLTAVMIYVNVALAGRRHFAGSAQSASIVTHFGLRGLSLGLTAVAFCVIVGRAGATIDATAEGLHTLQPQTRKLLDQIPEDRPVFIQAFFSPKVPQHVVQIKKNLENLLRKFDAIGGDRVQLTIREVEPYSELAAKVSENYNIIPRDLMTIGSGQRTTMKVYLGLVFTSGPEEFTIPFFDPGLPVEYELARSVSVVSQTKRKKIGIVQTDAKPFGGFDFESMTNSPDWSIVHELRKQYEVQQIAPAGPYPADLDALVAIMPSTMTDLELKAFKDALTTGMPTLIFEDPLPMFDPQLSPREPKGGGRNPFTQQRPQQPEQPKGQFSIIVSAIGLEWNNESIVWDTYNPHPVIAAADPEILFVASTDENTGAFSQDSIITSGLQEVVMPYAGTVQPRLADAERFKITPLMSSTTRSGELRWDQIISKNFLGMQMNPSRPRVRSPKSYTLGVHILETNRPGAEGGTLNKPMNVIFVPDADMVSETFFQLRRQGLSQLQLDNVTFALNCIDYLAGDQSFIELRKHRRKHRVLSKLEDQTKQYVDARRTEEESAEIEAQKKLQEAQAQLDAKVAELQQRGDLDERTLAIMLKNLEQVENRRLDVKKQNIEEEKQRKLARAQADMQINVARIQRQIKWMAALLPPIPTLLLAIIMFVYRYNREKIGVPEKRLVGSAS